MYTNTSIAMMNNATIALDFFEIVNTLIKEPEAKQSDSD